MIGTKTTPSTMLIAVAVGGRSPRSQGEQRERGQVERRSDDGPEREAVGERHGVIAALVVEAVPRRSDWPSTNETAEASAVQQDEARRRAPTSR